MSKRLGIPLAFLFLALLGGAFWQALRRPAPVYHGRPLTYWLRGFDIGYNDPHKPSFDESVEAVRQARTNALPTLLRMLRSGDSDLKHWLTRLAQKQRLIKVDDISADRQRWAAMQGFLALVGREAKYAIPQLIEISRQEVAGAYTISGGRHTLYATEILGLLRQQGEDVSEDVTKALSDGAAGRGHMKGGPEAATKASGNVDATQNSGPTRRSTQ